MGNIQPFIQNMNENDKFEFLIKEGLLNDEIIQLFRNGTMTSNEIYTYVFSSLNYDNHCNNHK